MWLSTILLHIIVSLYWLFSYVVCRNVDPNIANSYWIPSYHECQEWEEKCLPTIMYTINFNAQRDAMNIFTTLENQNKGPLINILTRRTAIERYLIGTSVVMITEGYQMTLHDVIKSHSELNKDFKNLIEGLLMAPNCFQRRQFRKALQATSHRRELLMDILGVLSKSGINKMLPTVDKNEYQKLAPWIAMHCPRLSRAAKEFIGHLDEKSEGGDGPYDRYVVDDAEKLIEAAEAGIRLSKQDPFMSIFYSNNNVHLRAVYEKFKNRLNKTIGYTLSRKFNFRNDLYLIYNLYYKITDDRSVYFAEKLYYSLTVRREKSYRKNTLNKILISRAEIDLRNIKEAYAKIYKHRVEDMIHRKLRGDYRDACIQILQNSPTETVEDEGSWSNYVNLYTQSSAICDVDEEFKKDITSS